MNIPKLNVVLSDLNHEAEHLPIEMRCFGQDVVRAVSMLAGLVSTLELQDRLVNERAVEVLLRQEDR